MPAEHLCINCHKPMRPGSRYHRHCRCSTLDRALVVFRREEQEHGVLAGVGAAAVLTAQEIAQEYQACKDCKLCDKHKTSKEVM